MSAIKYAVVDRPHRVDAELGPVLLRFLLLLGDADRHVRRAAVVALSGCAHAKPGLVQGHLPQLLPLLYAQTVVREDLIRVVDLGPFKHRVGAWAGGVCGGTWGYEKGTVGEGGWGGRRKQ